jgi:hypothetical protein
VLAGDCGGQHATAPPDSWPLPAPAAAAGHAARPTATPRSRAPPVLL